MAIANFNEPFYLPLPNIAEVGWYLNFFLQPVGKHKIYITLTKVNIDGDRMIKVLTIDDMDDITFSIKKSLENVDSTYDVIRAGTAVEGIKQAQNMKPDIILLDLMIPDMSGWEILKELKSNESTKNIPVIIITAKTDELSKQMGKYSTNDYIIKPFNPKELDKKIKSILTK